MKRGSGFRKPEREATPYISPGVPEHIDDLVLNSSQVQRRPLSPEVEAGFRILDRATQSAPRRRAVSPATPAQRARAKAMGCVVSGAQEGVDPAHVISRSMTTEGQDEPLAIVGLRRDFHRAYDEDSFDLLPYLTGRHDDAVAFAVERVGLITALERITNTKWGPLSGAPVLTSYAREDLGYGPLIFLERDADGE